MRVKAKRATRIPFGLCTSFGPRALTKDARLIPRLDHYHATRLQMSSKFAERSFDSVQRLQIGDGAKQAQDHIKSPRDVEGSHLALIEFGLG